MGDPFRGNTKPPGPEVQQVNARRYVRRRVEARQRFAALPSIQQVGTVGKRSTTLTAKKEDDDSVAVQFDGCDGERPNCRPIMPGLNYVVPPSTVRGRTCSTATEVPGGMAGAIRALRSFYSTLF
jgi:hypothetical protein